MTCGVHPIFTFSQEILSSHVQYKISWVVNVGTWAGDIAHAKFDLFDYAKHCSMHIIDLFEKYEVY